MNKAYNRINWENYPSDNTPINEQNLNKIDVGLNEVDNRVIVLDETKATKTEVAPLIKEIEFNESNGIFTITRKNGSKFTIDTKLEKIAINFGYDPTTQKISLTLIDGTIQYIDLSALITQYEFLDTDTVSFFVDTDGKVSAIVKEGSIEEKHLRPNYLAEIKIEAAKAESAATSAEASKAAAATSASMANAKASEAATSATNAAASATTAKQKAELAETSATNAASSADSAANSATTASNKANDASDSATNAANSASTATTKANAASTSASNADTYAKKAQSYAVGGTGTRTGEDSDNSKYYYEQAKSISEGLSGALRPMGTVDFADLPNLSNVAEGDMYNVFDGFVTTDDFKEGSGLTIPAGANVYKTADGMWDVLAGSPVTGVRGNAEFFYKRGNVNLTPSNFEYSTGVRGFTSNFDAAKNLPNAGGNYIADFEKLSMEDFIENAWNPAMEKIIPNLFPFVRVKGNAETTYRTGDVNLTPANIGALPTTGGTIHGSEERMEINEWGIKGNSNQSLTEFDLVKASDIKGHTLYYDDEDIDARYAKKAGDEFTGDVTFDKYAIMEAWPNYGSGSAKMWYNGSTQTLDFEGEVKNIDLNATSATKAIQDGNGNVITDTYLPLDAGDKRLNFSSVDYEDSTKYENKAFVSPSSINFAMYEDDGLAGQTSFSTTQIRTKGFDAYSIIIDSDKNITGYTFGGRYYNYFYSNNKTSLGSSAYKWSQVYAENGTIQTSDRNEKNTIEELSAEQAKSLILGLKPSTYKMNDGTSGRTHWGLISQDIEELLESLGMTSMDFAGFIKSPKIRIIAEDENGNPLKEPIEEVVEGEYDYSLRYDEFIAPMIRVIQTQQEEIEKLREDRLKLEERIAKIEERLWA